ncbi:MAG: tRNA (N(6)-L-threonylcarbamoyladenosine(37)-C(2))-methylthiotransferase MtaB [Alphaproteobacteria bacterium]|nr:tRNA (N(6)-L-threonylcarbamoyladenosine(37)-C(2))-methylthiotransferase MtaB [Alphaproteobacteria bacterium]
MAEVVTFGCRLNAYESEVLKEKLKGIDNLIVINTCAVTGEAERQCRQAIRKLRRENPLAKIVVTGCSAQVSADKLAAMPEVDLVLGNKEKKEIEKHIALLTSPNNKELVGDIAQDSACDDFMITGFEGRHKAFLQIQQGCNHRCTYCIIPYARGHNRSVPLPLIIKQIKELLAQGFKEICLTGVDICSYDPSFSGVVKDILEQIPELPCLQFGSLDPAAIDDNFIELVSKFKNISPHFHFSIQSGDNLILKRMGRRHSRETVIELCEKIRDVRPESTFGADFICGFPTESIKAFENTCKLVEEAGLSKLHVFPYSEREGTPAARMPQLPMEERRHRAAILRELSKE